LNLGLRPKPLLRKRKAAGRAKVSVEKKQAPRGLGARLDKASFAALASFR